MRRVVLIVAVGGVWISVAASVIGFVLPWATLDVKADDLQALAGKLTSKIGRVTIQFKRGTETIAGELLPDLSTMPASVSGLEIPRLVNRQDARVAIAFAEMFTGQRDLGAKSYAVYLVPGLALLGGVLVTLARGLRIVCGGIGGACLALAGLGCWKLLTTKPDALLVAITLGPGLWLSLWAYVGLGICAILLALD